MDAATIRATIKACLIMVTFYGVVLLLTLVKMWRMRTNGAVSLTDGAYEVDGRVTEAHFAAGAASRPKGA
ncbi:hypothetical protein PSACC_00407 [Paramicrosporidium saccamoebae]|uniref:Uncharacterized protein n=1 Tax=Paramicrosporidium saccamoebae TaxID=1246581 RepID=A0A2H9TPX3_9FUNG|nr:hypothetical protein PSACC_00407 [Paramicrosporidium saccamoebae]